MSIAGRTIVAVRVSAQSFTATLIVSNTDVQGLVSWNVSGVADNAGNVGVAFSTSTDASYVIIGESYCSVCCNC